MAEKGTYPQKLCHFHNDDKYKDVPKKSSWILPVFFITQFFFISIFLGTSHSDSDRDLMIALTQEQLKLLQMNMIFERQSK